MASFFHLFILGFVSLFPPVNPLGTSILVEPLLSSTPLSDRKKIALTITLYCLAICLGSLVVGSWLLKLFGISLPIVQIAGGIVIARMGWQMLNTKSNASDSQGQSAPEQNSDIRSLLFYPIAFPMTTGAGTISVILTLSARAHRGEWEQHLSGLVAIAASIVAMGGLIFLSYAYSHFILKWLGSRGAEVVNRLSAFLVFCVGIQIASDGLLQLRIF